MIVHRNASLTLVERREMVQLLENGATLKAAAHAFNVGLNPVRRWSRRCRAEGEAGLADRSCRPLRALPDDLRRQRLTTRARTNGKA